MTKGLSKSHYTAFCQCPKNLWLKMYKPRATSSWNQKNQSQSRSPPPLLRVRHLGNGKSLGEIERSGGVN